jgi:hypothetical protein
MFMVSISIQRQTGRLDLKKKKKTQPFVDYKRSTSLAKTNTGLK